MSLLGRITLEPGKCGGWPCIRVNDVLEMLAARVPEMLSLLRSPKSECRARNMVECMGLAPKNI